MYTFSFFVTMLLQTFASNVRSASFSLGVAAVQVCPLFITYSFVLLPSVPKRKSRSLPSAVFMAQVFTFWSCSMSAFFVMGAQKNESACSLCTFTFTLYVRRNLPELLITFSSRTSEKSSESVLLTIPTLSSLRFLMYTVIELSPYTLHTSFFASIPHGSESGL